MRRKKHKHTRRAVKFYKIHHGFREPYKVERPARCVEAHVLGREFENDVLQVVLDSSFVHALLQANLKEATELVAGLLGGQVRLFTTQCVMQEIKGLGKDYAGDKNEGHFFIGTQDKQLRVAISKVPAGASMFMSVNGMHLEQPSAKQEKIVSQASEEQQGLRASDLKASALKDVVKAKQHAKPDINMSIYRVQKAKGPNPMSMKKKKKGKQQSPPSAQKEAELDKPRKPARKRRKVAPGATGGPSANANQSE